MVGKMSKSRPTLKTSQSLVDEFLRRLKRRRAVKNVVQGRERGDLCDEEAKISSSSDRTGSNESNLLQVSVSLRKVLAASTIRSR